MALTLLEHRARVVLVMLLWLQPLSTAAYRAMRVEFQGDRVASTDSLLQWTGPPLPPLRVVTACARFLATQGRELYPLLSYATHTFDNELLVLYRYPKQTMKFVCCSGRSTLEIPVNFSLYEWHSFCLTADLRGGTYDLWEDGHRRHGQLPHKGELSDLTIEGGGVVVMGQEQDTQGGAYNKDQSMIGSLADLRVYNSALDPALCRGYTVCEDDVMPDEVLIDFRSLNASYSSSNVEISSVEVNSSLCSSVLKYDIVFSKLLTFWEARDFCFSIGGAVALPKSEFENNELLQLAFQSVNSCPTSKTDFIWLGFNYLYKTKMLVHYLTRSNLIYDNVDKSKITLTDVEDSCGTFNGNPKDMPIWFGIWQTSDCLETRCLVCHFNQLNLITLRGLCDKSYFDRRYFASKDENGTFELVGEYYSVIRLQLGSKRRIFGYWKLFRLDQPDVFATMERTSIDHYPTGLNNWTVHQDICQGDSVALKLSVCGRGQFTCNNGVCIPLVLRCNNERECPDGTDEVDCNPLIFPSFSYEPIAPVVLSENKKILQMSFNIEILSIKSVDLRAFQFTTELVTSLEWHDGRMRFRNLDMEGQLTKLGTDSAAQPVWTPGVSFMGAESTACDVILRSSELFIVRKSGPVANSMDSVLEDNIFSGDDNPFRLQSTYSVAAVCQFDFFAFPFDTQHCYLTLTLNTPDMALVPTADHIAFLGSRRLLEYSAHTVSVNVTEVPLGESTSSSLVVTVVLKNLVTYHVISTFAPTLTLLIIGCLSFHFPLHDFNDRVMVTLTTLLVEAQFFTQVSETMPRTAYLRLVDLWFLFCILSLFLIIVALVVINVCYTYDMPDPPSSSLPSPGAPWSEQRAIATRKRLPYKSGHTSGMRKKRKLFNSDSPPRNRDTKQSNVKLAWTGNSSCCQSSRRLASQCSKNRKDTNTQTTDDVTTKNLNFVGAEELNDLVKTQIQKVKPGTEATGSAEVLLSLSDYDISSLDEPLNGAKADAPHACKSPDPSHTLAEWDAGQLQARHPSSDRQPSHSPRTQRAIFSSGESAALPSRNYQKLAQRFNRWSQIAFPVMIGVFLSLYGGLAYRALIM